jgi:hypothetical protein
MDITLSNLLLSIGLYMIFVLPGLLFVGLAGSFWSVVRLQPSDAQIKAFLDELRGVIRFFYLYNHGNIIFIRRYGPPRTTLCQDLSDTRSSSRLEQWFTIAVPAVVALILMTLPIYIWTNAALNASLFSARLIGAAFLLLTLASVIRALLFGREMRT